MRGTRSWASNIGSEATKKLWLQGACRGSPVFQCRMACLDLPFCHPDSQTRRKQQVVCVCVCACVNFADIYPMTALCFASLHLGGCRFAGQYSAVFRAPAEAVEGGCGLLVGLRHHPFVLLLFIRFARRRRVHLNLMAQPRAVASCAIELCKSMPLSPKGSKALGALDLVVTALENQALVPELIERKSFSGFRCFSAALFFFATSLPFVRRGGLGLVLLRHEPAAHTRADVEHAAGFHGGGSTLPMALWQSGSNENMSRMSPPLHVSTRVLLQFNSTACEVVSESAHHEGK